LQSVMGDPKRRPHLVTFTSSSTVRSFAEFLAPVKLRVALRSGGTSANSPALQRRDRPARPRPGGTADITKLIQGIHFASIGPITSTTLRELGLPVHIEAKEYTIPGLIRAIRNGATNRKL